MVASIQVRNFPDPLQQEPAVYGPQAKAWVL